MAEEDYSRWSYEELKVEIEREKEALAIKQTDLASAQKRKLGIEEAIRAEELLRYEERIKTRAERIRGYERAVAELERQVSRFEDRVKRRSTEITRLETRIRELEARLPYVSPVERYVRREVIRRLRRTVAAFRGWQTRDRRYLDFLYTTLRRNRRVLAALRGWQTREIPLIKRLEALRTALATTISEIARLKREITEEEARLEEKRKYLPKFFKSHVIVSMDYAEQHLFEIHIIFPHLKKEITNENETLLTRLAFELMTKYGIPEKLLFHRYTTFNLGEVQTKPVKTFNKETEASIFDVKRTGAPVRTSYKIFWEHKEAWTETTLTGETIKHPPEVVYTRLEETGKLGREGLKEKWKKQAEKEAIQ